jgi:glutathione synthase/RimK-type ligase-like ATP-grasp enzyme
MPTTHRARVALVTYSGKPALTPDDAELRDALASLGADAEARPWDENTDWASYDNIVLRSCWNFHHRPREFRAWLSEIEARCPGALRNSPALARWSVDKRYLQDLADRGVRIVPTTWVTAAEPDAVPSLGSIMDASHAEHGAVVKPAISATAHETWRIEPGNAEAHEERFRRLVTEMPSGVMVQPFVPEILEGEWSLIFLGSEFSHAVVKRAAAGDFRVQHDYGGTVDVGAPGDALIADARAALEAAADSTGSRVTEILYARVDGVERAGRLVLMELELIEPVLFFARAAGAAARMAQLILQIGSARTIL